jgi:multiple antibiotic resistance protein
MFLVVCKGIFGSMGDAEVAAKLHYNDEFLAEVRAARAGTWLATWENKGVVFDPSTVSLAGLEQSVYVRFSLLALSSIFFLVDPLAALPTFLAVTAGANPGQQRRMAGKASLTALVFLTAFALAGQYIFRMFGITLPAFEIAGGIILLLIGLDMLSAKRSETQETGAETAAAAVKEDAGIVPLGIPMLAGPGAITSVMVLVGQAHGQWKLLAAILAAIFITAAICYLVLGNSARVAHVLGDTGIRILVRIMGLLLVALAVQYFVNGMVDLGLVTRPAI